MNGGIEGLRWPRFPKETLRRLFDAVDTDDVVDAHVSLPDPIEFTFADASPQRCYAVCLQFWEDGAGRTDLLRLIDKLLRNEGLSADERMEYKNIRARYKHLRFAQRLYSRSHRSGYLFDLTTRVLGHLQDAFRGGRRAAVVRHSLKLKVLLSPPVWSLVARGMQRTRLDDEQGMVAFQKAQMRRLKKSVKSTTFGGDQFHTIRKIVSMQVSYYDTVRSLVPNEHAFQMSRFLAAINGLMGARHDEMIAEALSGRRSYGTRGPLTTQIRSRIETLVARFPF